MGLSNISLNWLIAKLHAYRFYKNSATLIYGYLKGIKQNRQDIY